MIVLLELAIIIVAAGVVSYPFSRWFRGAKESSRRGAADELWERKEAALLALKDLELDHLTGKLSAEDFAELHAAQSEAAIAILQELDARPREFKGDRRRRRGEERRGAGVPAFSAEAGAQMESLAAPADRCRSCGHLLRAGNFFCTQCGAPCRISCWSCGRLAPRSETLCSACGAALARNTAAAPAEESRP
ncbi:MAG: zinc ribbon domain-containing protein [Candidatus Tectomicrobia bacterium]|nr:zinc ribbon domain-containing protein [Candidatus Tectomicrobia bacterium]